jgi:hypothetical protein
MKAGVGSTWYRIFAADSHDLISIRTLERPLSA